MKIEKKKIKDLIPAFYNPRRSTPKQEKNLAESLKKFGVVEPIIWNKQTKNIVGGHFRVRELEKLGFIEVDCVVIDLSLDDEKELNIRLNANTGEWDWPALDEQFDFKQLEAWGIEFPETEGTEADREAEKEAREEGKGKLAERFGVPPFTVLNAREGWWQERKRAWLSLGIKSELGREGLKDTSFSGASYFGGGELVSGVGGSIFDPVLAELAYSWFSPKGGLVLDPFAGGSVRGLVASLKDRQYVGVDLSEAQILANREQEHIAGDLTPVWHHGDSLEIDLICKGVEADFIFTCPPYADLEKYSEHPSDISNMPYDKFKEAYFKIIKKTYGLLKNNRFACIVVGDVRDKKGDYYNFVGHTIEAFIEAGYTYYNEAILISPTGSLAIRSGRPFTTTRKLGKTHQNVLVFLKGDAKEATKACGECEFLQDMQQEEF